MFIFFFFFQAEDGIRDKLVTGVQTCALPILIGVSVVLVALPIFLGPVDPRMEVTTSLTAPSIRVCTASVTPAIKAATTPSSALPNLVPVCLVASDVTCAAFTSVRDALSATPAPNAMPTAAHGY